MTEAALQRKRARQTTPAYRARKRERERTPAYQEKAAIRQMRYAYSPKGHRYLLLYRYSDAVIARRQLERHQNLELILDTLGLSLDAFPPLTLERP